MTNIFLQGGPKQTYFRKTIKIRSNIYQQFIIGLTMNNNVNDVQIHINVHEPKTNQRGHNILKMCYSTSET